MKPLNRMSFAAMTVISVLIALVANVAFCYAEGFSTGGSILCIGLVSMAVFYAAMLTRAVFEGRTRFTGAGFNERTADETEIAVD